MKTGRHSLLDRILIALMALATIAAGAAPASAIVCGTEAPAESCCCGTSAPSCCEEPVEIPEEQPEDDCSCDLTESPALPVSATPPDLRDSCRHIGAPLAAEAAPGYRPAALWTCVTGNMTASNRRSVPLYSLDCAYLL